MPSESLPHDLSSLLVNHRVLVCAGPGGVGKTTTAAALSLSGARRGLRVASLTVDPARRLADSLGLERFDVEEQSVDRELWAAGSEHASGGSLTVMMLDTKRTFDDLIVRLAPDAATQQRIFDNTLYQHLSTQLAGAHEYMAMEKLLSVKQDPRFDLIVLDTPPTQNALDFLTAPQRLIAALDGPVMRWLAAALEPGRGLLSLGLLTRGVSRILSVMSRITGKDLLELMARFVVDLDSVFGGFRQRASQVAASLRAEDLSFVLVSAPTPSRIAETIGLQRHLREDGMQVGAMVLNRVLEPYPVVPAEDLQRALSARMPDPTQPPLPGLIATILASHQRMLTEARRHSAILEMLEASLAADDSSAAPIVVRVPEMRQDPSSLRGLRAVARRLAAE